MADHVEKVMQDMVPELDDLRRKKIFDDQELRQIVKRRRDYEYSLQKTPSRQQDYLGFVRYEVALECLRSRRSKALHWRRKTLSDFAGIRRLHVIFERGCRKFKGDLRMWYQYIDFCLRSGSTKVLNRVLLRALKFHPREVHLWLLAADRELKLGHIKAARSLLVRGLRFAPKSAKLWGEFLRLEVRVALRLRATRALAPPAGAAGEGAQRVEPTEKPWAPARLLLRRALGRLSSSPRASAALLTQAVECLREAQEDAADSEGDGLEDFAGEVRAALAECRPGVAQGKEWEEAPEDAALSLWQLWWGHELKCGSGWPTLVQDVGASAPPGALRRFAAAIAARAARGSEGDAGDGSSAGAALAKLAEAPTAAGDVETALAMLEALECCTESSSDASKEDKATANKASGLLLARAAKAHPSSGRLVLLAAARDPARPPPLGMAAAAVARAAHPRDGEEAAALLTLAAQPEEASSDPSSASAPSAPAPAERRRVLEALLRNLPRDASAAPAVAAHVAQAAACGGVAAVRAACDEVRDAAVRLWDLPSRRTQALAAALSSELRCLPAASLAAAATGGTPPAARGRRLAARFEELLGQMSEDDPNKEDWWIQYMEFAHQAARWFPAGRGDSGVPTATDLHVRAMRSIGDQARFGEKAQKLLQQQQGGMN